ncbi:MAG TPA: hypothetical protein ENN65_05635, partial [Candidatus Hydrogenedentes bacterium]|nr:hypothetical protein [Candidatus Hydrogenedentota bacterium]
QSNLKQWGLICKMYANEARGGEWPPLQARAGNHSIMKSFSLTPWLEAVYPEYLNDLGLLSCPSDLDSLAVVANGENPATLLAEKPYLAGRSYGYFGWVVDKADRPLVRCDQFQNLALLSGVLGAQLNLSVFVVTAQLAGGFDAQLRAHPVPSLEPGWIQEVLSQNITDVSPHPQTGETLGNGAGTTIYRLREGVERFLITDINSLGHSARAQSTVWVMFDQTVQRGNRILSNHQPGGANVLYMDGHVAYVGYEHGPYDPQLGIWLDGPATPPVMPSMASTLTILGAAR